MKYGRKPDDYSRPKLDLTQLAADGDFSMVPATQENISPEIRTKLQMLGNDVAGDCEAARWANHRLLMTGSYPANVMDAVWSLYQTQNPQFNPGGDPNVDGPGSPQDQGMSTDALLDYLHKNGGSDGAKVIAYGTINPANIQAVERAIALFGAVWVDILVQPGNQREFHQKQPWTDTGEQPEGAHAVLSGGYVGAVVRDKPIARFRRILPRWPGRTGWRPRRGGPLNGPLLSSPARSVSSSP